MAAVLCFGCKDTDDLSSELNKESQIHALHLQNHYIEIYKKYLKATVSIAVPGIGLNEKYKAVGSGFFINDEGYIITCRHVVEGRGNLYAVQGLTGKTWPIKVYNEDKNFDLALCRADFSGIKPRDLEFIPVPPESSPKPGSIYVALGAPHGLADTITNGIVSYTLRLRVDPSMPNRGYVQLSESVFPGSSGGPVLDLTGSLIGMTRFTLTPYGPGSAGPGFAIPANHLYTFSQNQSDIKGIREKSLRGIIEIPFATPFLMRKLNLPHMSGVIVSYVLDGSPAHKAGIRRYDFITHVENMPVANVAVFQQLMIICKDKKDVSLSIVRDGATKEIKIEGFIKKKLKK